jgi:phage gp16-like protein
MSGKEDNSGTDTELCCQATVDLERREQVEDRDHLMSTVCELYRHCHIGWIQTAKKNKITKPAFAVMRLGLQSFLTLDEREG